MQSKTGPILVGLGFIALTAFLVVICAQQSDSFAEFSQYWGLFGTIVGVATGSIPAFFFQGEAKKARVAAVQATERANSIEIAVAERRAAPPLG